MMSSPKSRYLVLRREFLIFLGFLVLTVVMTWPWALHLRDGVRDEVDSYGHAYVLWWDYHQTFHDPVNLFHATIFYPYRYTLATGEDDYGIALLFFPLFALGARPLTVYVVAAFLSFPFIGYGTFRLARTLSGSNAMAWVAGVVIAFLPYRFNHLSELQIIFAGWVPLLLEALVLFARRTSWARAAWLGLAFVMNALTALTWFMLTMIPLAVSAVMLMTRYRLWRDRKFWLRAATVLAAACLLLLPFLLPFLHLFHQYHFVRTTAEVQSFSAHLINWLAVDDTNRLWRGLGSAAASSELVLFPGVLAPLLALAALFLIHPKQSKHRFSWRQTTGLALDLTAIVSGIVAVAAAGYEHFKIQILGRTILSTAGPRRALAILSVALLIRCVLVPPQVIRALSTGFKRMIERVRSAQHVEVMSHGLAWCAIGFIGSFGQNLPFHRWLFQYFFLFRSMRVATRWAMICYVGLALLAGLGAWRFGALLNRYWPKLKLPLTCGLLVMCILFELRVAPMPLVRGDVDPDQLALYLKPKKMSGGIVELPAGMRNPRYMLRAADHGQPLVTAVNSFCPPTEAEIESLTASQTIPDGFLDLLESIPASYLVIHNALCSPDRRLAIDDFLKRGESAGRLRFIKSFVGELSNGLSDRIDLYAIARNEPQAQSEAPRPPPFSDDGLDPLYSDLLAHFQETGFLVYRFYKTSFARAPRFAEIAADARQLTSITDPQRMALNERAFAESWVSRPEFRAKYDAMNPEQYVTALVEQSGGSRDQAWQNKLAGQLRAGAVTRGALLLEIIQDKAVEAREFNPAFVLFHYFAYLERDPDEQGYRFWLGILNPSGDYRGFTEAFIAATERQVKQKQSR